MNRQAETCRHRLHTLLQQETGCMQRFGAMLGQEFSAVTTRDIEALETVIQEKLALLARLEELEQERNMLLGANGYASGLPGMQECLQWCDPQRQLTVHWTELLTMASVCREENRRNRQLVELCSQHARATLRVLRGEDPRQDTYDAEGETRSGCGQRSLARA
jgi:flagellar biosynthesis/type III secretory pathway chaperone